MAPLPKLRTVDPWSAFSKVGVDYAGPFATTQGRGRSPAKRYICLFTCLQSRAVHLEPVYSMDTAGFLMAFGRFCNRRGTPKEVLSDNGSNFKAAEKELTAAVKALKNSDLAAAMSSRRIKWHFNPPHAPHFGGVFEALIKSAKRAMAATLSQHRVTDEEFHSAAVYAEGFLNKRPLTTISTDPLDLRPLTPSHFLTGHLAVDTALEQVTEGITSVHPHDRWKRLITIMRDMWRRWLKEYLPMMNLRRQWHDRQRSLQVGEVVMYLADNTPRGKFPLGRIREIFPGVDGLVRVVDVEMQGKLYRRPVHQLIPLEVNESAMADEETPVTAEVKFADLS